MVGSSTEGNKQTSVCVTPHKSWLTPPQYKNKRYYKCGTNDKTHDSGVSKSDDASVTRNLDAENKNAEDDEYVDHPSIKMIELILNHMKIPGKDYYWKSFH